MNVSLSQQQEGYVRDLVSTGRYNSASEVVRTGLRLLEEREMKLSDLRALIREGVESGSAGRIDVGAVKAEARAEFDARQTQTPDAA